MLPVDTVLVQVFTKVAAHIQLPVAVQLRLRLRFADLTVAAGNQQLHHRRHSGLGRIVFHPGVIVLIKQALFHINKIRSIQKLRVVENIRFAANGHAVVNLDGHGLLQPAFFGGNHNYPVSGPHAPDGSGSGILQNGDALNIVGVQVVQIPFVGEIVDNHQRAFLRLDGTLSANTQRRRAVKAAVKEQGRGDVLQPAQHIGAHRPVHQPVVDVGVGAQGFIFRQGLVARGDHYLSDGDHLLFEVNVQRASVIRSINRLPEIPDMGDMKSGFTGWQG
ncbi:hypothetical protein NC99_16790 [Sunxiuqinia dokdonensis]|uniref:Uncharacterized protein n=1 Tax=Sunxiuqinia dokdonensis TaxID=1409788 RepID=A0A0L8VAN2_9BACT|nr:hypothetical protein NC99_16790 [Sunxiuqinia dokdonensis]